MRKLLFVGALLLIAAVAFAQNAPAGSEIYGQVWLDYDASGARLSNAPGFPVTASDFSFSRMRFGLRNTLADNVKTWFEIDPRNLEFRQVNLDWTPVTGLDLMVGKQAKLFAQNNDWIFGDRTLGIQARYTVPGLGWAGVIVGSDADITNLSSKKLGWEGLASTSVAGINQVNPGSVMVYPQVTVKPDTGKDISLEAGINAEINASKLGIPAPTGSSLDAYAVLAAYGASVAVEYTYKNFNDSATVNRDHVLYTRLSYNLGVITPTAYFVVDNLTGQNTASIGTFANNPTPNATLMVELPFNATKDLVIDPFVSYAVSGDNLTEYYVQGWSAGQLASWPQNDWTAGLRIKYAVSSRW